MNILHVRSARCSRSSRSSRSARTITAAPNLRFVSALLLLSALTAPASFAQTDQAADQAAEGDKTLEEVVVVGTQIKGAAISEALSVSVMSAADIESFGVSSGQELLDFMPEQGQNFVNEAENISGGVNSARGDIGAFNLRNMGTGNTLVLLNGRRMVQAAGYQTEEVGGSFVPVNSVNSNALPVFGIQRVEVLRDGASAIYGADAVAGVVNTVLKRDFEGLIVQLRWDEYDNIPRNDQRVNLEWGQYFNQGRTNLGIFADFYHRDRVSSQDDPRWANSDLRWRLPPDSPWADRTTFRNDSIDSGFGQFDLRQSRIGTSLRIPGITDSGGDFETFPWDDPNCQGEGVWYLNEAMCGRVDELATTPDGRVGNYRYNLNENRDLASELDRYNVFFYLNHEFENGVEAYTEFAYYEASSNLVRHPASTTTNVELVVGAQNYYNPFGPCGSPNRLPDELIGDAVPCEGHPVFITYYRWVEYPRIVDTDNDTWRFLQGFRGVWGEWDWDAAVVWSEASRKDVTHNRISNNLMQAALNDPTPSAYNPFNGGLLTSNVEQAFVDVYRKNETDLKMVDFKLSKNELFNLPAGPVGFLAGFEYREESFVDDRDPRLDGTITFTNVDGETYPYISDVMNSSPSSDSAGSRDVTSLFVEFAVPVLENLDVQLAMRYEDLSDVGDTTVGKVAFGWRPFEPFLIRGSWSEAFRAPNLITVNEGLVVRTNTVEDRACRYAENQSGINLTCSYGMQRRASGSQELVPEESTNTSIGFVWDIVENLTVTVDFWSIEKTDTIGLFGEANHTALDLLLRLDAGLGNCSQTFNPAVGRAAPTDEEIAAFTAAGICPAGNVIFIDDRYANLDTRTVEGHDIGVYYDVDTRFGDFSFKYVGTFYDKYEQTPGPLSQQLLDAEAAGIIPAGDVTGFGDLIGQDGNQDEKHNASVRWRKGDWAASLSAYRLGGFYQTGPTFTSQGVTYVWTIPSMTTYNASFDYNFDLWRADSRIRLGINNFTDERAPLADDYFGYFADAHSDYGRYWYLDLRMQFD